MTVDDISASSISKYTPKGIYWKKKIPSELYFVEC